MDGVDLVVVGGPTHVHGMSRASTRKAAIEQAAKSDAGLSVDRDANGPGVREWLASLDRITAAAAFDTRVDAPAALTGRASKAIARELRNHGAHLVVEPESFLVSKENVLEPREEARAEEWGRRLSDDVVGAGSSR